ncbi:MAG: putative protease [Gammaproteobacteria bacterium]|nr:MAG: putative protease [Gammaproteobacteria bacterium]TND06774.1 MAG: putative protease [Gammaproteobacteria bacterium]
MKLLAIDTSTEACSAALYVDNEVAECFRIAPREHAVLILPMIEQLLGDAGLSLNRLDALAFGRGPGSFTGVRIAAGVIQGLAYGAALPVVPVSSLAALAEGVRRERQQSRVLAAFDARIGEVYWGAYQADEPGRMVLIGEEQVCPPKVVPEPAAGAWFGAGSGWRAYIDALTSRLGNRVAGFDAECYPHAADVARLAVAGLAAGQAVDAERALPVYLRDNVARKMSD